MGICDSSLPYDSYNSKSTQDNSSASNKYYQMKNEIIKNNKLILKKNNGFILPENLARRENEREQVVKCV